MGIYSNQKSLFLSDGFLISLFNDILAWELIWGKMVYLWFIFLPFVFSFLSKITLRFRKCSLNPCCISGCSSTHIDIFFLLCSISTVLEFEHMQGFQLSDDQERQHPWPSRGRYKQASKYLANRSNWNDCSEGNQQGAITECNDGVYGHVLEEITLIPKTWMMRSRPCEKVE